MGAHSLVYEDKGGLMVRYIHLNNLLEAKRAAGCYKDLDDIEKLSL